MAHYSSRITQHAARVIVIGIGNEYRRDDAVGLRVVRLFREKLALRGNDAAVEIVEESGEGTALMERWKGKGTAIMVDAMWGGREAGTIYRFEIGEGGEAALPLSVDFFRYSTHAFGLGEAIELARSFGTLPPLLKVYGIEAADMTAGIGLTPEVEASVDRVVAALLEEVQVPSNK